VLKGFGARVGGQQYRQTLYMKIGIQIVAPFDVLDGPADYRVIFRAVPTIV
jgi:hypothetical protein